MLVGRLSIYMKCCDEWTLQALGVVIERVGARCGEGLGGGAAVSRGVADCEITHDIW